MNILGQTPIDNPTVLFFGIGIGIVLLVVYGLMVTVRTTNNSHEKKSKKGMKKSTASLRHTKGTPMIPTTSLITSQS